jgi:hypothetical protein
MIWPLMLTLPLFLIACAGAPKKADQEADVKARAEAYWKHRIRGELAKAYAFEDPQFREKVTLDNYYKVVLGNVVVLGADVKSVAIEKDWATVTVNLRYKPLTGASPKQGISRATPDYWQLYDGVWYHHRQKTEK